MHSHIVSFRSMHSHILTLEVNSIRFFEVTSHFHGVSGVGKEIWKRRSIKECFRRVHSHF